MRVLESAEFIAERAENVKINAEAIAKCASTIIEQIKAQNYSRNTWKSHPLHPKSTDALTCDWIFVMDLMNFSFWHERSLKERYTVTFDKVAYTGYWALCAAIQRSKSIGIDITSPGFYNQMAIDQFHQVFAPDDPEVYSGISLPEERFKMLKQAGHVLVNALIQLIGREFGDSFKDECEYDDRKVCFYKRAQILVADLWACFDAQGFGCFSDIDTITMFADYRVPQALVYYGMLEYSSILLALLKEHEQYHAGKPDGVDDSKRNSQFMLQRGDKRELEIRGCSIWAVELLLRHIRQEMRDVELNAIILDFYLWDMAKANQEQMKHIPIHLTRSIYY